MEKEKYVNEINSQFKLPIYYNEKKTKLNENIVNDLELTKTINDEQKSIYSYLFKPTHCFGNISLESFTEYYTTDISFLKETQLVLKKNMQSKQNQNQNQNQNQKNRKIFDSHDFQKIFNQWNEIKGETGFCEKYLYIDWEIGKFLNNNPHFLQAMSIYNIASPLLSLFLPIFILIVPFFIIKFKGVHLSMNEYIDVLKLIISNHAIGKIFTKFHEVDVNQKIYLSISAAFYVFSIYQNILICIRFYSNTKKIHDYLLSFKEYLHYTIDSMDRYLEITEQYKTYKDFNNEMIRNKNILIEYKQKLEKITPFRLSLIKLMEIGHILQCFYELYDNKIYNNSFLYSFGFHGYLDNINGLTDNIQKKYLFSCKFVKKNTKNTKNTKNQNVSESRTYFKKQYYPNLIESTHIKNNCDLTINMIITGPNASGKTTLLKTTLINTILSQQFGYGCYENANIIPFDFLHCYLNIPDTSGRDSLFQAEARRCKEIIDCINKNKKKKHLCIFDELYSGTNPEEAVISANAFMEYLINYENVSCMLTTHYIDLCRQLETNKQIKNFNMKTTYENDHLTYTYELQEGISEIKGGLKVLKDMNYPTEIINKTNNRNR